MNKLTMTVMISMLISYKVHKFFAHAVYVQINNTITTIFTCFIAVCCMGFQLTRLDNLYNGTRPIKVDKFSVYLMNGPKVFHFNYYSSASLVKIPKLNLLKLEKHFCREIMADSR